MSGAVVTDEMMDKAERGIVRSASLMQVALQGAEQGGDDHFDAAFDLMLAAATILRTLLNEGDAKAQGLSGMDVAFGISEASFAIPRDEMSKAMFERMAKGLQG